VTPVLLDTGCIVAMLDRSERHHRHCVEVVSEVKSPLITCEAVVAESCYLLRNLPGAPAAVLANVEQGIFQIPFRLDEIAGTVKGLLHKYRQLPIDLADACLVAAAERLGTARILTLDSDFGIYRWRRTRPLENLLTIAE
jgi:predicted nucleic acid-binding protein